MHFDSTLRVHAILGTRRHDDDDYEAERKYHWDFEKETVLTTNLNPYFTFLGAWARSIKGMQDPPSGDNRGVSNSYRLQVLSWNTELPRGDDHSAVANHSCGPWHIICLQEGAGVANHPTLHHRFHVVTGCHCAVLLNKDTCERDVMTKPIMVPEKQSAEGALEGIVVKGRFRRPVAGDWHHFSILNDHVNQKCAARRSICINLLLLIRSWCVQEGVTVLAGVFYKGAQRGRLGEPYPLEAFFR